MLLTPARALAPAVLVLMIGLTACGGADSDSGSGSADTGSFSDSQAGGSGGGSDGGADGGSGGNTDSLDMSAPSATAANAPARAQSVADQPSPAQAEQALIRHGNVALNSHDVGKDQFEVQKVVDRYAGQVTDEKTTTDDGGKPAYTRMVLRIPAGDFDKAMEALKGIGELESADTTEDDVTTKVIDTRTRLTAQRRSIARITVLFDRAQSIRDIMAIESQLTRRQADLESLEHQAAYLANQTTLSTITVSIDQIPEKKAVVPTKDDKAGFVSGLSAGWHGLTVFAIGLATVLGAVLPWLVVVVVLGPPLLLLVRRVRKARAGRSARTPSAA